MPTGSLKALRDVGGLLKIERRYPTAVTLLLGVVVVFGVSQVWALGEALGLSTAGTIVLVVVVVAAAIASVLMFVKDWHEAMEDKFLAVVSRTTAELQDGMVVRICVKLDGTDLLATPFGGHQCVYYRAAALIEDSDGYETYWSEARIRTDGQIASAKDSTGAVELDLRSGIQLVGTSLPWQFDYDAERAGDPLGVGLSKPYRITLQLLRSGDDVEVVGRVERLVDGRHRIVPVENRLQLRVLTARERVNAF